MHKALLAVLFSAASLTSFAQVSWGPTPGSAIPFAGSLTNSAAPATNIFTTATANIYDGAAYRGANFEGTDDANGLSFKFESASANDSTNFNFLSIGGANLRFSVGHAGLGSVHVDAGTYHFHFDLPVTSTGEVSGFTAGSDVSDFASAFTFSFDGNGGVDLTQTGAFDLGGMDPGYHFTGNLTATAVPEPATTAALFAVTMGAFVAWRRRRN